MGNSHPDSVIQYAMIMISGEMVYESDRVFPSGIRQNAVCFRSADAGSKFLSAGGTQP